jgi:hypothetical protein
MGSSTGNMLVDRREALERIFSTSPLPIMTHCEDTDIINRNMAEAKAKYGDDRKLPIIQKSVVNRLAMRVRNWLLNWPESTMPVCMWRIFLPPKNWNSFQKKE